MSQDAPIENSSHAQIHGPNSSLSAVKPGESPAHNALQISLSTAEPSQSGKRSVDDRLLHTSWLSALMMGAVAYLGGKVVRPLPFGLTMTFLAT
jgi:hypothetical protein